MPESAITADEQTLDATGRINTAGGRPVKLFHVLTGPETPLEGFNGRRHLRKRAPLAQHDGPGKYRGPQQDHHHRLDDRTCPQNQVGNG